MNKTNIVKNVVSFVVGAGTYRITKSIIDNNTDPENTYQKVTNNTAAIVIGTMASDATTGYTDQKIDEIIAWWNETFKTTPTS